MRIRAFLPLAVLALAVFTPASSHTASAQQLAQTPPMGWNSWNYFASKVDDKGIRAAADQIVATGMKDAGYVYVNIDDTWEGERDANGVLHTNSKFPDMKALADYVHSKGLKIGIYSGPGPKTCAGYEGSLGHEEQDAKMYAEWGIDYLKYDLCSFREAVMQKQAPNDQAAQMKLMIAAYQVWEWAPQLGGNLWRTTGDIQPRWMSIYNIMSQQAGLAPFAGPGHWNDPDMLEVGNGRLSLVENRTHFAMWAMLAAPLLAGNDLPNMKPEIRDILTNRDVIAIDQDPEGHQAHRAYSKGQVEVWMRDLSHGAKAIAIVNAGADVNASHPFHLDLTQLGLRGTQHAKDLWTGKEMELKHDMPIELASHDIILLRIDQPK